MGALSQVSAGALLPLLLVLHGFLGGADTLLNHELVARLPQHVSARRELAYHALREAIFGALFIGLAWYRWLGAAALVVAILVLVETLNTAVDEFEENRTRVLPQNERVMHAFLTLNLGLIIAAAVPTLLAWGEQPTAVARVHHGIVSWVLTVLGCASLAWSIRDLRVSLRLQAQARPARE